MNERVYIIGFMGAGKSAVSRQVSRRLNVPWFDIDKQIAKENNMKIPEIFEKHGEDYFRKEETRVLEETRNRKPMIVSCGGGVVAKDENRDLLKKLGLVVYLEVTAQEALARISNHSTRPLLAGDSPLSAATSLLEARKSIYAATADVTICTSGLTIGQVTSAVISSLKERGVA